MVNPNFKKLAGTWWFTLLVTLFLAFSVRSSLADWNDVPTGSMIPTILEGDRIYVNKLAYDLKVPFTRLHLVTWDDPARGDIVVFRSPQDGKRLVKRVIGLPGEVLSMEKNRLIINGEKVVYEADAAPETARPGISYLSELLPGHEHLVQFLPHGSGMGSFPEIQIPEGTYLMLGDNRDNSADSRVFGFVPRRNILGQATAVALSFDINRGYRPRWVRFFKALQ